MIHTCWTHNKPLSSSPPALTRNLRLKPTTKTKTTTECLLPVPAVAETPRARGNLLHAKKLLEAPPPQLSAEAAPLVAAPGGLDEGWLGAVLPHDSGPKRAGHAIASFVQEERTSRGGGSRGKETQPGGGGSMYSCSGGVCFN